MSYYDKRFIEEYLCNRTNMFYRYKNFYDAVGKPTYNEIYTFKMKCELLEIVNDKIRIYYHIPINDKNYSATFVNDKYPDAEPTQNLTSVFFKRSSEFGAYVQCEFHPDLYGLNSLYALFHTKEGKDLNAYAGWNFSADASSRWWDSMAEGFWYAEKTTMLVYTVVYKIGYEQIANAYITVMPE